MIYFFVISGSETVPGRAGPGGVRERARQLETDGHGRTGKQPLNTVISDVITLNDVICGNLPLLRTRVT